MAPALPPQRSLSDTLPLFVRTRHGHALHVVPCPAAKQMRLGRSPRAWSAACTTQASSSSASTWAARRIWYPRPSVCLLRAPSKLYELTKTLPSSRLTPLPSLARSQCGPVSLLMLASASASSVVFRQQRQVHRRAGAAQERAARFMHSQSSVRGDYKSRNLGSRNGAVRDVSYAAATQSVLSVCLLPVLSPVCLSVCLSVSATLLLWIHGWIDYTNAQRSPLEYGAYA